MYLDEQQERMLNNKLMPTTWYVEDVMENIFSKHGINS
jgi:hypothetical protein